MQRSALCRSRREHSNEYLLAKIGVDTAENEPLEVLVNIIQYYSFVSLGVTPDEIVKDYGADTLRLYEMFMGPFDKEKLWNSEALIGSRRFLDRFYALVFSDKVKDDGEGLKLAHKLVDGVQKDIDEMLFNTAISKLMTFVNEISKLPSYSKTALEMATQALAPFAPHMAEECWAQLGHD